MKFSYTKPKKDSAVLSFTHKDTTRFVEKDGVLHIELGAGKEKQVSQRKFITLTRKSIRVAREQTVSSLTVDVSALPFDGDPDVAGKLIAENMILANYEFTRYKSGKKPYQGVSEVVFLNASKAFQQGVKRGTIIGEEVNRARDLANTPGGDMTPQTLAAAAQKAAKNTDIKVTVLGKQELKKIKAGLILGVAQGSPEEPKLIIMEYYGAGKASKQKPVVLVGKGVTFDTGGINLKPEAGIFGMHHDMAGGASVIGAVTAAARLKLKKNVIGVVPAVENMPSGTAYRPGDVLTSLSGKTVEVLNTDAEGRLILADALTYVKRFDPRLVLDVATLTGASLVALGQRASAIMTRDEKLECFLRETGESSGDYVWPLPLWKEYDADIRGNVGDISNLSQGNSRYGGAINGGIFLAQFAEGYTWAHIDMAPRMEAIAEDNLTKGATGAPVRLLVEVIEKY